MEQQQSVPRAASDAAAEPAASPAAAALQVLRSQHLNVLSSAVLSRQADTLRQSDVAQLADVLAFMVAAGQRPGHDFMTAAITRAVDGMRGGGDAAATAPAHAPALVALLWACAMLRYKPHPSQLHMLLASLQRGLHLLGGRDLADVAWALAVLKHRPGDAWLGLYVRQLAARAGTMTPQSLTDATWALACFAASPDSEALRRIVSAGGAAAASGELGRGNGAVLLWALQQLGVRPGALGGTTAEAAALGSLAAAVLPTAAARMPEAGRE